MKKKFLMAVSALTLIVAAQASAVTYSDADYFGGGLNPDGTPIGIALGSGQQIVGGFDLVNPDSTSSFTINYLTAPGQTVLNGTYTSALGFTPGTDIVEPGSISLLFFFRDPNNGTEAIAVSLADITLTQGAFAKSIALANFGGTVTLEGLINANGGVSYTITSQNNAGPGSGHNGFTLDAAYLSVATTSVPDGGATAALLGCSFLGLAYVRNRFALLKA